MNHRLVFKRVGWVLMIEAVCMIPSLLVSLIYRGTDILAFVIAILITFAIGFLLSRVTLVRDDMYPRDGFVIVALGWVFMSLFGLLPFILSGAIPSFFDALFEVVSGLTTTGASILRNVEALPKGILFWRSFTHWIGGMGVLALLLLTLRTEKASNLHILRAEMPGPSTEKFVPKLVIGVRILYIIYISMTLIEVILLLFGGMSVYDALINAFGTASTGGFSNYAASVGAFHSVYIEIVIGTFMLLFGANLTLYYLLFTRNLKSVWKDEELRLYAGIVMGAIAMITVDLRLRGNVQTVWQGLRYSFFQVSSIVTTTGFATTDFTKWSVFSQSILVLLMLCGACAGSTAGGIKQIRILLLFRILRREIGRILHPKSVRSVTYNEKSTSVELLAGIPIFIAIYFIIIVMTTLVCSLDNIDLTSTLTAVISAISNIGPGLGIAGPAGSFADFSNLSKALLSLVMLTGRLEIYPMLMIFVPAMWKK